MNPALEINLLGTGVKAAAMLFIVLGVLLAVLYFLKRVMQPRLQGGGESDIRLLSSRYISNKERIEVLEVAGEKLVVGITPGRISFLTKLDPDPHTPDQHALDPHTPDPYASGPYTTGPHTLDPSNPGSHRPEAGRQRRVE